MNVKPIAAPLAGEQVVGADPGVMPVVDAGWQRRLHLYTGRSLSDAALTLEQTGRAGRLAMAGRGVSHGVVQGLEVGLDARLEAHGEETVTRWYLHLAAGTGITIYGEDVVVPQAVRVALDDLYLYTPRPDLLLPRPPARPPVLKLPEMQTLAGGQGGDAVEAQPAADADAAPAPTTRRGVRLPAADTAKVASTARTKAAKDAGPTEDAPKDAPAAARATGGPAGGIVAQPIRALDLPDPRSAGPVWETGSVIRPHLPLDPPAEPGPPAPPRRPGDADAVLEPRRRYDPGAPQGPLSDIRERGWKLPRAAVLVLQPAVAELVGRGDPMDPCELDPQDDAFADWQLADGTRVVLYAFPWEDRVDPVPEATWRNRLAYEVFAAEAELPPGERLPWEEIGVPVGLVGFGADGTPLWVDGFAVVRDGGRPHRRTPLLSRVGDPFLWQARLKQFAEQVAEVDWSTADPLEAFHAFAWLPPAGLLPRAAVRLRPPADPAAEVADAGPTTAAFPEDYLVEAVPVPLEQLDAAIEASAALEPFSATAPDRVRLLVPVPQAFYEPKLLQTEEVDPQFEEEIDALTGRRTDLLLQREDVERKAEALGRALAGRVPGFVLPQDDPDRLEPQEGVSFDGHGLLGEYFLDRNLTPPAALVRAEAVNFDWGAGAPPGLVSGGAAKVDEFSARWTGTVAPRFSEIYTFSVVADDGARLWVNGVQLVDDWNIHPPTEHSGSLRLDAGVRYDLRLEYFEAGGGATVALFWSSPSQPREPIPPERLFLAADTAAIPGHTPVEDDFGTAAPAGAPVRRTTALDLLGAQLTGVVAAGDLALLGTDGLDAFVRRLDARIKRVDDQADFGFLRVQSDMYRLRQLMLGATSATRLATSPALAAIVSAPSALEVRDGLLKYMEGVKAEPAAGAQAAASTTAKSTSTQTADPRDVTGVLNTSGFFLGAMRTLAKAPEPTFSTFAFAQPQSFAFAPQTFAFAQPQTLVAEPVFAPATTLTAAASLPAAKAVSSGFTAITRPATRDAVIYKAPIVGEAYDFRTVTVAERLQNPAANEAKSFAVLTRFEVLQGLAELDRAGTGIPMDDVMVAGFIKLDAEGKPVTRKIRVRGTPSAPELHDSFVPVREPRPFGVVKGSLEQLVLEENDPPDADETVFFAMAVELLDATIATLRNVEGRVQRYRDARDRARAVLQEVAGHARDADRRLKALADDLAETRHDLAVARALLKDEEARVRAVNDRRAAILRDQVPFYAFQRPRLAQADLGLPARPLDPAFTQSPLPACLAGSDDAPPELRGMVEVLREAPLRFFNDPGRFLAPLDGLDLLRRTLAASRERAARHPAPATLDVHAERLQGKLGSAIGRTLVAQQAVVGMHRERAARLDLAEVLRLSWARARDAALDTMSLGDLIDAAHGRTAADRGAARELDDILKVAACLYRELGEVKPAIRLDWAEALSEYDQAQDLHNLYALPRWTEVEYLARRGMQSLVDWLFGRVAQAEAEARALMSDVVRVAILLASHAPVKQIVAAAVPRDTEARVGGTVELAADPRQVRVGMHVLLYDVAQRPVHAVVEDLTDDLAVTRVLYAAAQTVTIARDARAQLGEEARLAAHAAAAEGPLRFGAAAVPRAVR